jgi:hypothetical protein
VNDALLVEIRRAMHAFQPDSAEELLREVETRLAPGARKPLLTRGRLVEEIEPAVRAAFPDRAEALLGALTKAMWPGGVIGPFVRALSEGERVLDLEHDEHPSFVVLTPRMPWSGLRLLVHLDSMILGSAPEADFPIPDPALSPRHVMITRDATGGVLLEDVGNSEILVNGKQTHWTWVRDGDVVVLTGSVALKFLGPA